MKNTTGVDTLKFAKKVDSASLKSEVDKLNTGKLEKVPNGLNSLKSKVDVVKENIYNAKIKKILKIEYLILLT